MICPSSASRRTAAGSSAAVLLPLLLLALLSPLCLASSVSVTVDAYANCDQILNCGTDLDTGVHVKPGKTLHFSSSSGPATWTYEVGVQADFSVEGNPNFYLPVSVPGQPYYPDGALVYRVQVPGVPQAADGSDYFPVFPIGTPQRSAVTFTQTGELFLAFWDINVYDNAGSAECTIREHSAGVKGDPIITGFFGQRFLVHGQPGAVYNLLTSPELQLNTRFVQLQAGQAMTAAEQKQARLLRDVQLASAPSSSLFPLPATVAWNHPGTYNGEMGVQLACGARLHGRTGAYDSGWAELTLDGVALPVSAQSLQLCNGSVTVARMSPHSLLLVTPSVSFQLVNSDWFFNVDRAVLRVAPTAALLLDGLLGQTADPAMRAGKDNSSWRHQQERGYRLQDDNLFGSKFPRNLFVLQPSNAGA